MIPILSGLVVFCNNSAPILLFQSLCNSANKSGMLLNYYCFHCGGLVGGNNRI